MKSAKKVFIIIAASLMGIGLICMILAVTITGFNFNNFNYQNSVKEVRNFNVSEISSINTNANDIAINMIKTNGNEVVVTYYTNNHYNTTCVQKDDKIEIQNKSTLNNIFNFDFNIGFIFNYSKSGILIEIPDDYKGDLNIKTTNGKISLSDLTNLSNVDLKTNNAKVIISNVESKSDIYVETLNGAIDIDNCKANNIKMETNNARISLNDIISKDILDAKTGNGRIEFDKIISDNFIFKTSNGSIKGDIIGNEDDYSVDTKTSNSSSNLTNNKNGKTDKSLKAKTSNGKIEIDFVD